MTVKLYVAHAGQGMDQHGDVRQLRSIEVAPLYNVAWSQCIDETLVEAFDPENGGEDMLHLYPQPTLDDYILPTEPGPR